MKIGDVAWKFDGRPDQPAAVAANGPPREFRLLAGSSFDDPRLGSVESVAAQDLTVGARSVHATRLLVAFAAAVGAALQLAPPLLLEVWQSPDVPLGTVAATAMAGGRRYTVRALDFGRGFRSAVDRPLDETPFFTGAG